MFVSFLTVRYDRKKLLVHFLFSNVYISLNENKDRYQILKHSSLHLYEYMFNI